MATRYAVASGNWSDLATWDGGVSLPGSGDDVYADGKTVVVNQSITVLSLRTTARSGGTAGGTFVVSDGVTLNYTTMVTGSSDCLTVSMATGTATINGPLVGSGTSNAKHGMIRSGNGTLTINGNVTGGPIGGSNSYGLSDSGGGVVNIVGNVTGGMNSSGGLGMVSSNSGTTNITGNIASIDQNSACGLLYSGTGTVNITGNYSTTCITYNNVYAIKNSGLGTINITGDCVAFGPLAGTTCYAIWNSSTGTVNITGNIAAGVMTNSSTAGTSHAVYNSSTGTITFTGNVTAGPGNCNCINSVGGLVTFTGNATAGTGQYANAIRVTGGHLRWSGNSIANIAGATPGALGIVAYVGSIASGSSKQTQYPTAGATIPNITATPTIHYGATAGGLGQASQSDVRYGIIYGPASELTGTCRVPAAGSVALGVPIDATTGTASLSDPAHLLSTTIATLASQTSFTLTAGSSDNNTYVDKTVIVTKSGSTTRKAVGTVSAYTGSTRTITLSADPAIFTMAVGDSVDIIAGAGGGSIDVAAVQSACESALQSGVGLSGNVTGKVLGGGSGTITGVGAYVKDHSGNAVMPSGSVTLATSQPNYAPAKAGDAMTLTSDERTAVAEEVWAYQDRTLTMTVAEIAVVQSGNDLVIHRGDTTVINITGLGSLVDRVGTKLYFTVKDNLADSDSESIVQITETGGLLILNGEEQLDATIGSLVVNDEIAGNVTITLKSSMTKDLQASLTKKYSWDIQIIKSGDRVETLTQGILAVNYDVTQAID